MAYITFAKEIRPVSLNPYNKNVEKYFNKRVPHPPNHQKYWDIFYLYVHQRKNHPSWMISVFSVSFSQYAYYEYSSNASVRYTHAWIFLDTLDNKKLALVRSQVLNDGLKFSLGRKFFYIEYSHIWHLLLLVRFHTRSNSMRNTLHRLQKTKW